MPKIETEPFHAAEYLQEDEQQIMYLQEAYSTGSAELISKALHDVTFVRHPLAQLLLSVQKGKRDAQSGA